MIGLPMIMDLAGAAIQAGWTRERVLKALADRIQRDQRYLTRRIQAGVRTSYDELTESDLNAFALAACWLVADTTTPDDHPHP